MKDDSTKRSKKRSNRYLYKVVNEYDRSVVIDKNCVYCLQYKDGTTVMASNDTVGIFCFRRLNQAASFRIKFGYHKIKRVIPLSRTSKIEYALSPFMGLESEYRDTAKVFGNIRNNINRWIRKFNTRTIRCGSTPKGTCVCSTVYVVGEVKVDINGRVAK